MSEFPKQHAEGPRWEWVMEDDQAGWQVTEEDRDHPAFEEDGRVDFFLPPLLTTDRLDYLEVEEGQTADAALREHFGLPPESPTAA